MKTEGLFTAYPVMHVRHENQMTRTLVFDGVLPVCAPGQYVMAWLPGIGEKPFSVSGNDPLALTIAEVGLVSHALTHLLPGDRVWIRGPFGKGFSLVSQSHLLIGGGYGAAPLSFLASQAQAAGHAVCVALGAKTQEELMMVSAFERLGCLVYLASEDGSAGTRGLVTALIEQASREIFPGCVYACGPTGMLLAVGQAAKALNLPVQLSFEALIRCGVGLCGSCELGDAVCHTLGIPEGFLVCHDGPVAYLP